MLGYQQRGGAPSAFDRILATRFGNAAVNAVIHGQKNKMVGIRGGKTVLLEIQEAWKVKQPLNEDLLELARVMSH